MILGIESSCDDSSVALLDSANLKLVYHKKISQECEHSKFGGVVPELAARLHTAALPALLDEIKPYFSQIKAVAVTNEPGLSVSLVGGVSMAKALAIALRVPLIGVNHLVGHIYSLFIEQKAILPLGVLLVSGGHTLVLNIDKFGKVKVLARTNDDSFGESFDKVAKMMNLGYPGGATIEKLAKFGDENSFEFTIPIKDKNRLEYSFSGLKNQVRTQIEKLKQSAKFSENLNENLPNLEQILGFSPKLELNLADICDISASFQKTAILHILDKLKLVFAKHKFARFAIVGGASANLFLREEIEKLCEIHGSNLLLAPLKFCSDNAAMIARAGVAKYERGEFAKYDELQINPTCDFSNLMI